MRLIKSSIGAFFSKIGSAVVGFIGTAFAARIVGPSIFGVYSLFYAVVRILVLVTDLGIGQAAMKRISEGKERGKFLSAALITKFSIFCLVFLFVFLLEDKIVNYIGNKEVFIFLPVVVFLLAVMGLLNSAVGGEKKVGRAQSILFFQDLGRTVGWIILLSIGFGLFGLIIGSIGGYILSIIFGIVFLSYGLERPSLKNFKSLFSFSKFSWLMSVRGVSWVWTDTIVLGFFVTQQFIGIYEVSWRISLFFAFASSSIGLALFPNVSELATNDEFAKIENILEESIVFTGILAIPGFFGSLIINKGVLSVFGKGFTIGNIVLPILVLSMVFYSYETVFSKVINGLDRPKIMFKINSIFLITNIIGNVVLVYLFDWIGAAIATSFSVLIASLLSFYYLNEIISFNIPVKSILKEIFASFIMLIAIFLVSSSLKPLSFIQTLFIVTIGGLIYFSVLLSIEAKIRRKAVKILNNFAFNY